MAGPLRIVSLLLIAVCVVTLTACGGAKQRDEKNAYVKAVNAAQNELAANVATVASRITNKSSSSQDRKTLADIQPEIDDGGSAKIVTGVTEIGEGILTVLAQIAAHEMGVKAEHVVIGDNDT